MSRVRVLLAAVSTSLLVGFAVTGAGAAGPQDSTAVDENATASTEPTASSTEGDAISIVVIGDSIPFNSPDDCPGCTSFADSYGAAVEAATGQPVEVENRSRHDGANTAMIEEQLESGELDELLAAPTS